MPEASVLYSVTALVVLGLVVWVAAVLRTAKEPWTRDAPPAAAEVPAAAPVAVAEGATETDKPAADENGAASADDETAADADKPAEGKAGT